MSKIGFLVLMLSSTWVWSQSNSNFVTADSLYSLGNYSKAIELYKTDKDSIQQFEKIAKAFEAIGNYDMALEYYARNLEINPNPRSRYAYAKLLSKTKNFTKALETFDELIKIETDNPEYHYQKGVILEQLKGTLALESYKQALKLDAKHQKAIYKIAREMLKSRNFDKSLELVDDGLGSYKNNVELISLKGQNLFWKQDYHEAIIWFEKLLKLNESTLFVFEKLRDCYAQTYQYEKALFYGEEALNFEVNHAENLFSLALIYEGMGNLSAAEEYIKASIKEKEAILDQEYTKLGYVLNRQKKYDDSIEVLKKAIEENPQNQLSQFYLLNTQNHYYEDLDYKISLHEKFLKKHPEGVYHNVVKHRLGELKKEKFMKE